MIETKRLAVCFMDEGHTETSEGPGSFLTLLREIDERRAWDSAYDAALAKLSTEDAYGDVPSAVGEICAAHADAKLVERRKRWGGA